MNIYNDTTKGIKAFLLRIKDAKEKGLLGNYWNEASGKRADILQEWFTVAGEQKLYPSTFELISDIIEKLDKCSVAELEAIGDSVEYKLIHTKHKRFYMAEFLREAEKPAKEAVKEVVAKEEAEVAPKEEAGVAPKEEAPKPKKAAKKVDKK